MAGMPDWMRVTPTVQEMALRLQATIAKSHNLGCFVAGVENFVPLEDEILGVETEMEPLF